MKTNCTAGDTYLHIENRAHQLPVRYDGALGIKIQFLHFTSTGKRNLKVSI